MSATAIIQARHHLARVGAMGSVGRFTSVDAVAYPRGSRVVVRTSRGLEVAEVLAPPTQDTPGTTADGSILRGMTVEDQLLEARLLKRRDAAFSACAERLRAAGSHAVLLDVEHLFDGRNLFFYFLGNVPPEVETLTAELAEIYDAQAQFRQFAETLTAGCGPGCGTESAAGHGCTNCSTGCAVSGACGVHKA